MIPGTWGFAEYLYTLLCAPSGHGDPWLYMAAPQAVSHVTLENPLVLQRQLGVLGGGAVMGEGNHQNQLSELPST